MDNLSISLDSDRTLWLTEISRVTYEDQVSDALGGDGGQFIVLENTKTGTFSILAKAASSEAGRDLLALFANSQALDGALSDFNRELNKWLAEDDERCGQFLEPLKSWSRVVNIAVGLPPDLRIIDGGRA